MKHTSTGDLKRAGMVFALILLGGCATIRHSTPELSAAIAQRTADMQAVHEQAVRRYFAAERRRVEDFFNDTWVPQFLRNLVGSTGIVAMLATAPRIDQSRRNAIASALRLYTADEKQATAATEAILKVVEGSRSKEPDLLRAALRTFVPDDRQAETAATHVAALLATEEPAELMIEWARDAQSAIEQKRRELIAPIDEAEQAVLAELTSGYADLRTAQALLTARLEAAADVKDQQDRVLKDLGADKTFANIKRRLIGISDAVGTALDAADNQLDSNVAAAILGKALRDELRKTLAERSNSDSAK